MLTFSCILFTFASFVTQIKLTKSFWVTFILDLVHHLATFRDFFIFLLFDICNFQLEWDPKKIRQEMKDKEQQQQQQHQVRQYLSVRMKRRKSPQSMTRPIHQINNIIVNFTKIWIWTLKFFLPTSNL